MRKPNFKAIEKKWQKKWEKEKIFEANPDKRKKFFGTFPYPYINGYSHIGHLFSIMRLEVFSRYKRLRGYNVLFPQGWHVTGSPIVSAAKRIKEKEPKQIKIIRDMGIKDNELRKFEKPEYWVKFFAPEYKKDYSAMGLSIDWRRNFVTSSLNPYYDKFIKWQFRKLREKGFVEKNKHPVVWDYKVNMPVGDHDRVKGEGETPQELYLFKFKLEDGRYVITATLRHDTIRGITNIYVNPDVVYKEVEVKKQRWIIGEPAINKLKNQEFDVVVKGNIKGIDLIGKKVEDVFKNKLLVLPATFLDVDYGTGMVHSVPSDSADDLIALRDLQKDDRLIKKYKLNSKEVKLIEPIEIFETPGIGGNSAQYFLDKYDIKSQNERGKLDRVKKELYKLTFTKSKFNRLYRKGFSKNLEGMSIPKGQEIIKNDLLKKGYIEVFYELTGEVISRNLTRCVIKIVSDQWFIKYGDKKWKKQVHSSIKNMKFYPETVRSQFEYVIDWLNDWACTREYGLGTKLPFDEKWVIEALSDSTIYMAYYTIAHLIKDVPIEKINDEFFDYVFLGKGKLKKKWKKFKEEFDYWYPLDFRNSGKDLVQNHLTFFLFNHIAIFPKKYWPKSIGVNGWVKVDNQKMSKSLGNFILLRETTSKFGADASRLTILNGGEAMDDPNWDTDFARSLSGKFNNLGKIILDNHGKGRKDINNIDKWMQSSMNKIILDSTKFMEETLFRSAIQKIFFDFGNLIKRYLFKTDNKPNKSIFDQAIKSYLIMLSPFCPHITEELWEKIGGKGFISLAKWPIADEKKINEKFEKEEQAVEKLIEDVVHVMKLVGKEVKKAFIYVLPNEKQFYVESLELIKKRTELDVVVYAVNDKDKHDPENKSKKVKPGRLGVYLE